MEKIQFSKLPNQCFLNPAAMEIDGVINVPAGLENSVHRSLRFKHQGAIDPRKIKFEITCKSIPSMMTAVIGHSGTQISLQEGVTGAYTFSFFEGPASIEIGRDVSSNGIEVFMNDGGLLKIGNDVMFASGITLHVGDNHAIFDIESMEVVNYRAKPSIQIDNHVWVGQRVSIVGDVHIGKGSILAGYSVVTKSVAPCTLVAGNPAVLRKENVSWTRSYRGGGRELVVTNLFPESP